MKNNKLIYTVLFLTSAVSCSNFRPIVLTNAFINPESTTNVDYEDLNFSYALFNQYASGLTYQIKMDYSTIYGINLTDGIYFVDNGAFYNYNEWDTITGTFALKNNVSNVWRERFNTVFFDRDFDRTTKKANFDKKIVLYKWGGYDTVNYSVKIKSKIAYQVNVGSVFLAFNSINYVDNFYIYLYFYDVNDALLQTFLLDTTLNGFDLNRVYDLSTIITNVSSFEMQFQWVDTPPFVTATGGTELGEFNLFTQNQEISIPDDASGDRFGFEFVAVEWWNILGHLQNFTWWIFNQSPIAPLFQFIEDYVLTWISGLITFITGIFRL